MNQKKTIKLRYWWHGTITIHSIIGRSIDHLQRRILSNTWHNRPVYDEDAGVYVSQQEFSPFVEAQKFAALELCEQLREKFTLTRDEVQILQEHDYKTAEIFIEREISFTQAAFITQTGFLFLSEIEKIYNEEETELFESDNHYTGKKLEFFLEKAKERAVSDKRTIRKILKEFSDNF